MTARCPVFVVAEGPSELGDLAADSSFRRTSSSEEGFLRPILRRLVAGRADLDLTGAKVSKILRPGLSEPRDVLGQRARQALAMAQFAGCRALVFMVDTDREQGVKRTDSEGRGLRAARLEAIEAGFRAARTHDPTLAEVVTIAAVPLRMLESWALADVNALSLAGGDASEVPKRSPEKLWGKKQDPSSDYPKHALARVFGERSVSQATFADLARTMDIEVARRRCPLSFAPFVDAVHEAVRRCTEGGSHVTTPAHGAAESSRTARPTRRRRR